jgi:hypothetical protein
VKPYYNRPEKDQKDKPTQTQPQVTVLSPSATTPPKQGRGRPRKYPLLTATADIKVYIQEDRTKDNTQFSASRQKELTKLLTKDVFDIVKLSKIPNKIRLFNFRFVNQVKNKGTNKAFKKSRLVIQAYNNSEKALVLT